MSETDLVNRLLIFILVLFTACVERVDLEFDQPAGQLVVNALVSTDTSDIQTVNLSRAVPFSSVKNNQEIEAVNGAQVMVLDDLGNEYEFGELADGFYQANFKAEVGNTYTLQIETPDGGCYTSSPQLLMASVEIDETVVRYFDSSQKDVGGFYVYIKPKVLGEGATYFRWTSHYIKNIESCYTLPIVFEEIRIGSEQPEFNEHLIARIPFPTITSVLFEYRQYSISAEAFEIYNIIKQQAALEGSIFDPAQGPVRSNIFSTEDPAEEVLGIFQVSDVLYGHMMVHRGQFGVRPEFPKADPEFVHPCPGPFPTPDMCPPCPAGIICPACFYGENMTTERPENWSND